MGSFALYGGTFARSYSVSNIAFYPQKQGIFAAQTLEIDESDENAGCRPDKRPFAKSTVLTTPK